MPRAFVVLAAVLALVAFSGCKPRQVEKPKDYARELPAGQSALREVDPATLPKFSLTPADRAALDKGIGFSLAYLAKASSKTAFPAETGISHDQVQRSLEDFRKLLATASDDELDRAIRTRYRAFMSVGWDGSGEVLLSGYYTPIVAANWTRGGPYQYPVYKRPPQLVGGSVHQQANWKRPDGTLMPCPSYGELESTGVLAGQEIAWFAEAYDAYNVRVQGSAKIRLPDGKVTDLGYAGTTGHEYTPISKQLVADGKIPADRINAMTLRAYFLKHPEDLPRYAGLNPRGTFFTTTSGGPFGSLGQMVTSDVTVATNKQIFPPAALMLVQTSMVDGSGRMQPYCALRLDQDTGGAMRAPGRADLYMGIGDTAGERAGGQWFEGAMWYLILKD